MQDLLKSALSGKRRVGQNNLVAYLNGKSLTKGQAIKAKCYDCLGMGDDSRCESATCSLYPFSQFKHKTDKDVVA